MAWVNVRQHLVKLLLRGGVLPNQGALYSVFPHLVVKKCFKYATADSGAPLLKL